MNRIRKTLENRTNMEDERISVLETQLAQARLIAEESDKKYEEVRVRLSVTASLSIHNSVAKYGSPSKLIPFSHSR